MGSNAGYDSLQLEVVHRWDEASVAMLYKHFYKALVAFADRMLADRHAAEEIVQDTFLKTWQRRNQFQSTGALKAYLYNAVRNGCISHLRHKQVERGRIDALEAAFTEMHTDENGEEIEVEDICESLISVICIVHCIN